MEILENRIKLQMMKRRKIVDVVKVILIDSPTYNGINTSKLVTIRNKTNQLWKLFKLQMRAD